MNEKMTPHEKLALIRLIEKLPTTTPCNACVNYDAGSCQLWEDTIPKETLPNGCDNWDFSVSSPPF